MKTWALGASFIYILYKIGERTETCRTSACISLGADISPSTKTMDFLFERNELSSLIILAENFKCYNLYIKSQGAKF
jgi:hypothetical protein